MLKSIKIKVIVLLTAAITLCCLTVFSLTPALAKVNLKNLRNDVANIKQDLTNGNESKITYTDPQKPIMVKKSSPTFSIYLQSNPTTGFSWSLKNYDPRIIQPLSRKYYLTNKGLIGGGGYEKWTFQVNPSGFVVPQTTNITLIYTRPWELQSAQAVNFKVVTTP